MNTTTKLMTLLLALILPATVFALPPYSYTNYEFAVDGIYYKIVDNEACVTYQEYRSGMHLSDYHGDVVIPAQVTYQDVTYPVTTIDYYAFNYCQGLTSITIPESITTIKDNAFYLCTSLTCVNLLTPSVVIEKHAFSNCTALTTIICPSTTPPAMYYEECFDSPHYESATLHVPASAVESYRNAPVWKKFVHIQAIDTQPGEEDGYEYVPFVREGVKWVYYIDDYNYHVDFYTNPARGNNTVYRTLELKGDTLINDKIYKALHLYSGESIDEENDTIPVFLREEDKKVYGIIPDGVRYDHCQIYNFWDERLNGFDHWYNGEEFLLYDFQNPAAQWENLLNSFDYDEDFYTYTRLFTDTIPLGNKLAKRYVGEINSHEYQTIEGVGLIGYNSTPFLLFQPLFAGIHDEIYGLEKVVENGEVIYPQNYVEDGYLPLISEGVKWVNERVTVNHGDTTCYYYTYEFKGNHPVTGIWGLQRKALYRYEGLNHQLDTEQDSIVSGLRENGAKVSYFNNVPLDDVISQGRDMIDFQGTSEAYDFDDDYDYGHRLLYGMSTTESGWLNSKYYYTEFQRESFLNDDNFVKADPIMIDGYKCSRLAYIGEQGDTLAYIVEGIGFDSRDMGDLLTPFTRKPDPNADYQEWWGLSHVVKDGKIIYKGMRYRPNVPGDVNGDGEITVGDANSVIDIVIMGGNSSHPRMPIDVDGHYIGDVNSDGEITIADINSIIDMILNKN
ncbi:MAG: leucine-rich repeat protein [Muribaculaceae bacterium]|nr:leucine-rich repeat protein [Muribaculaceae bacterium]